MNPPAGLRPDHNNGGRRLPVHWFLGLLLVAATVLAYQPVWHAGFIWDDDVYITQNRLLSAPDGLWRIWFSKDSPSQYFPLIYTSFRLEHALWGFNPAGYHWVNLLLHAANALLVWRVLASLKVPGAWLAAALFSLHPVQVETVAWVTERKNILSLFFFLLALLGWLEFAGEPRAPRWRWYGLALVFYVLALLSKTTACTLPAALVLTLWLKKQPINLARVAQMAPFVGIGLAMGLFTMWWERYHIGTHGEVFALDGRERLLIASHGLWFYGSKLAWPVNLTFSYPRWDLQPGNPLAYGWLLAGLAMCGLLYYYRRRLGRGPEVAVAFYIATLSPMLGFIMLFTFRYTFVADHYQYVACIGPLALAAAGLCTPQLASAMAGLFVPNRRDSSQTADLHSPSKVPSPPPRAEVGALDLGWVRAALCVVLVFALGTLTWRQARVYKSVETLWRDTIAKNPDSWLALGNLGTYLMHQGRLDEAMDQFQKALQINPRDVNSLVSVGNTWFRKGNYDEAAVYYRRALEVNPNSPEAHANLAVILANRGQTDEAIEHDRQALLGNPNHLTANGNLAVLLARQGRYAEALEYYQKVLAIDNEQPLTRVNLALALSALGRTNEANAQYLKAADVLLRRARDQAQQGRLDTAESQYREALRLIPNSPEAHFALGLVLVRQDKRAEARREFSEVLRLKPGDALAQRELEKLGDIRILKQ